MLRYTYTARLVCLLNHAVITSKATQRRWWYERRLKTWRECGRNRGITDALSQGADANNAKPQWGARVSQLIPTRHLPNTNSGEIRPLCCSTKKSRNLRRVRPTRKMSEIIAPPWRRCAGTINFWCTVLPDQPYGPDLTPSDYRLWWHHYAHDNATAERRVPVAVEERRQLLAAWNTCSCSMVEDDAIKIEATVNNKWAFNNVVAKFCRICK
jgi:hypothetical protein